MHFNYTNYCYNVIVCPWMYTCTCNLKKKNQHMHKNIRISGFVNLVIDFPQAISIHKLFFLWINRLCFSCKLTKYIYTYIVLPVFLILYRSFWPLHSLFLFNGILDCLQLYYFYLLLLQNFFRKKLSFCQSVITQDWSLKDLNFM